jgi:hypothetical protein
MSNVYTFDSQLATLVDKKLLVGKKIWMTPYLCNTLSFVNLDYRCTNLPSYYIEPSILHKFVDQYAHTYKFVILIRSFYMVLDLYAPIWQVIVWKLSILQFVGIIHTHPTSYCCKLRILQLVGLFRTYVTSCCMVGAIYSKNNHIMNRKNRYVQLKNKKIRR